MKVHTHRYHQRRYWSFLKAIMLTTVALFFAQQVFSTNYYARANGDWNDKNTWSLNSRSGKITNSIPGPTDNVFINGYIVSVSQQNFEVASVVITNNLNDDARLVIKNGKTLSVSGDIFVTSKNRNKSTDIWVQGDHSTLNVGGDITIERVKENVQTASNKILVSGTALLHVHGDVAITMQNSAAGFPGEIIVLNEQGRFICDSNLILRMAMINDFVVAVNNDASMHVKGNISTTIKAGKDFNFIVKDNGSVQVDRDFLLTQLDGEKVTISVENTVSGINQFTVNGNFNVLHELGDNLTVQAVKNGELYVKGNFNIDWTGSSFQWNELHVTTMHQGAIAVGGNMNVNMTDPHEGKLIIDLDDQSTITVGIDDGKHGQSGNFTLTQGSVFDFRIDQDASFISNGNLNLSHNGTHEMFVMINQEGLSNTSSALLEVKGDLLLNKTNGSQSYFEVGQNGKVKVHGNSELQYTNHNDLMQVDIIHLEQQGTFETWSNFNSTLDDKLTSSLVLNLKDKSHFKVGQVNDQVKHSASFNVTKGYQLILNVDNDATLEVNGDFYNNFDGTGPFEIYVNFKEDGANLDGQIKINGNWNINKTNGDRFYLLAQENANVLIEKNLIIKSDGHDLGDLSNESIILKGNANLGVKGSFCYTLNEPVQKNSLILYLEDHANFTVGENNQNFAESLNLNLNGGNKLDIDINGNAKISVFGDLNISQNTGNEIEIDLNHKNELELTQAQLQIARNFNISKSNSSQFDLHAQKNAVVVVNQDLIFDSREQKPDGKLNEQFVLEGNAKMNVKRNFYLKIDDPNQANQLLINLRNNVVLTTGSTINDSTVLTTIDGLKMNIHIDDNAAWHASGHFNFNYLAGAKPSTISINGNSGTNAQLTVGGDLALNNIQDDSPLSFILHQSNSLLRVNGNIDMRSALYNNRVNLVLENSALLELGGNFLREEDPYRYGNFTCNGTSTLALIGTKQQILAQSRGEGTDAFKYNNVIINNTSKTFPQVTTEGDAYVMNSISFVHGIVSTNQDAKLVLMENGTVNSASNSSYVDGIFGKIGGSAFTFPIGDGGFYAPLTISESKSKSSQFDAQYVYGSAHSAGYDTSYSSTDIANISQTEYWLLNRPYGDANVSVSLNWHFLRSENIGNNALCDIKIARWDGSTWINEGNAKANGNASAGSVTTGKKNNCESISKITAWVEGAPITLATKPQNVILDGFVMNEIPTETKR